MTEKQFAYKLRDHVGVPITEDYTLWRKPLSIDDGKVDGIEVKFKTITEALDFVLDDGRKVRDIVETWSDMPEQPLDADIIWHIKGGGTEL